MTGWLPAGMDTVPHFGLAWWLFYSGRSGPHGCCRLVGWTIFGDNRAHHFRKADHTYCQLRISLDIYLSMDKGQLKASTSGPETYVNVGSSEKTTFLLTRIDWLAWSQLDLTGHTSSSAPSHCICWRSGVCQHFIITPYCQGLRIQP